VQNLVDNFSKTLDAKIKQINGLKKEGNFMQTLSKRIDLLSFCMAIIERARNEMLVYKENNKNFNPRDVIQYDYDMSDYAERFYDQANKVIEVLMQNAKHTSVQMIPMKKKETLLNLAKLMMEVSARWHIERIINVFEFDTPNENRAFPKRKPLLQECIFFADRMNSTKMGIKHDDGIMPKKIIFAVQPSAGKSFVANVYSLMSLCLHHLYFKTSGILRMSNNSSNAEGFADQIKAMIENEKIALIYPEFKHYFSTGKPKILEKSTSGEWKIADLDPRIRASHFARGRDSAINSIRIFVGLVIDDLSDGFDQMSNDEAHQAMTRKYYVDMESRGESDDLPVFILGTMFNEYDIQNTMIKKLEDEEGLRKDKNYRDVRSTPDYSTVVIEVDCYTEDNQSYAPRLISTEKLKQRQNSLKPYEFDLVYRQVRTSREPRIFDYGNLKIYDKLPDTLRGNKIAVLDPTRTNGGDFFSLPVFAFDTKDLDPYFLDCIYEQKSLGKIADPTNKFFLRVVKFLIDNNVKEFYIENNTSNTLGTLFEQKFIELGYTCKIFEFFTAKEKGKMNKLERILYEEPTITANIHFPKSTLYPPLHRISQFMTDFTRFDSKIEGSNRKQHDDAPDSIAIFSKRCLFNRQTRFSTIVGVDKGKIFGRR
jgi:hypothetical protein